MGGTTAELGIGMVGYAFMGRAHSHAWRTAPRFFDLPLAPRMRVVAGRDGAAASEAAKTLGWDESTSRWEDLLTRDDVDLIDVCTPGDTHAEIAIAALDAGKHVLCEKPLANTLAEAEAMADAAARAAQRGVLAMVGFSYRRVPAIQLARTLVADGRIGQVRHVRAQYLQDWLADPLAPHSWRLDRSKAGSGALGDIGAHAVDLAQFVTGESLTGVNGMLATFVPERPLASGAGTAPVTVDDAASFLAKLSGGGIAVFEATRYATGRRNALRLEVSGTAGALAFDLTDLNVLHLYDAAEPEETAGFRRIEVTESVHPYTGHWWPVGHGLGYEHAFSHQVVDLVTDVAAGRQPTPSFADGLAVQRVLDAVERSSAADGSWVPLPTAPQPSVPQPSVP